VNFLTIPRGSATLFSVMVVDSFLRCFWFDKPIISEIGNLVHHDHLYQVLPEFLKRLTL